MGEDEDFECERGAVVLGKWPLSLGGSLVAPPSGVMEFLGLWRRVVRRAEDEVMLGGCRQE
jgi:hypothetical protein